MGETSNQIERHIQETRNDLSDNFLELEEKVKTAVDWRAQFEKRPGTLLALAFGGGILLSALLPSRRSARRKISEPDQGAVPVPSVSIPTAKDNSMRYDDRASEVVETWNAVKGALVGVATAKLSGLVEELVPGFKQEFTKAQNNRGFERSIQSTPGQAAWKKSAAGGAD